MNARRACSRVQWPAGTEYGVLDLDEFRAAGPAPLPPLLSTGAELLAELEQALEQERLESSAFGRAA